MELRQSQVSDVLVRVQRFMAANSDTLAAVNTSGARKDLDAAQATLTSLEVDQSSHRIGALGETTNQGVLIASIRETSMKPIAKVAKTKLRTVPQFSDLLLPAGEPRGNRLAAAAEAMADAATPYVATFTAAGLKPDFLDTLRNQAAQLRTSLGVRTDHVRIRSAATIGLGAATKQALDALNALDGVVGQALAGNTQLLAQWQQARHIPTKSRVKPAASTPASTPTPAPASASTPSAAPATPQTSTSPSPSTIPPATTAATTAPTTLAAPEVQHPEAA